MTIRSNIVRPIVSAISTAIGAPDGGVVPIKAIAGWTGLQDCRITPIESHADWALVGTASASRCDILDSGDGDIIQVATNTAQSIVGFKGLTGVDAKASCKILYEEVTTTRSTFHLVVRGTDNNNFIGYRNYNGEHQVFERIAGAFNQLDGGAVPNAGITGKRVELKVVGDVVTLTADGVIHVLPVATALLTGGAVGFIARSGAGMPISMMREFSGEIL